MATLTEVKNGVRIEKDFLGEKEVPNYAYYGVQTMRAVENFPITGYKIHEGLIRAFAVVKKAAALANTDVGRLELNKG
ncbi:lyase family protein, partial [Bacillus paranthracis]|nr:lyase family protein [Bacillus paranthracis]